MDEQLGAAGLARVDVGGHSVAYRTAGSGPPLVLLHGFLCDSRVWRRELEGLSDRFRVVAWDAPGAGGSTDPPEPFSITEWGVCQGSFLDAIGIARTHVLGLSWGGLLAQEFYRLHPERAAGLILADTYAGWLGSLGREMSERRLTRCLSESSLPVHEFVPQWVPAEFFSAASPELEAEMTAVVADFHPTGFRLMARALAENDTSDLLRRIEAPTLLLWGDGDRRSPLEVADAFRSAIRGAELVILSRASHVSNMEQPEAFDAHVRRLCLAHP